MQQNVVSAWVEVDAIVPGARCRRLRWPVSDGSPSIELTFAVSDALEAREALMVARDFADPVFAPILDFVVEGRTATVRYGGDLDTLVSRRGDLAIGDIVRLVDQILAGLEQAHARGLQHACLNPGCIRMTTAFDGRTVAQVIGLGLPIDSDRSPADDLTDIATTAYQLVTGKHPNQAREPGGALLPMGRAKPDVSVPQTFEQAISRALGDSGFSTAAQLRLALVTGDRSRTGGRIAVQTLPHTSQRQRPQETVVGPLPVGPAMLASSNVSDVASSVLSAPATMGTPPPVQVATTPPPARRRTALWIGIGALLAAGVLAWILLGGGESTSLPVVAVKHDASLVTAPPPAPIERSPVARVEPSEAPVPPAEPPLPTTAKALPAPAADKPNDVVDAPAPVAPVAPTPSLARLLLTSEPAGAEVSDGVRLLGRTPLTAQLPSGRYTLVLRAPEHEPYTLTLDLVPGTEVVQSPVLVREAAVHSRRRPQPRTTTTPRAVLPTTTATTAPPAEPEVTAPDTAPPRPRLLGAEVRPKILGQEPAAPIKVLGTSKP